MRDCGRPQYDWSVRLFCQTLALACDFLYKRRFFLFIDDLIREIKAVHRVVGITHQTFILGRNFIGGKAWGESSSTDKNRTCHACVL